MAISRVIKLLRVLRMAIDAVSHYLNGVGARRLADAEWGLTIADEHPLHIGIRVADGLVRVQAFAVPAADAPADEDVLHWNRATRVVRFARTRAGDLWVQADVLLAGADTASLDQVLGLVVEASRSARAAAYDAAPADGGWLGGR
jgi:Putative bacterial sensory transduction regulator